MKKFILLFFLSCFCTLVGKAQVTITPASLSGLCVGNTAYTALGNITINTETAISDIANADDLTLIFTMPSGFELEAGQGSTAIAGGGASLINSTTVTASTITINYDAVVATTGFTISGLRVRSTSLGAGDLIFSASSTGSILGMAGGTTVGASFTSVNPPAAPSITGGTSKNFCVGVDVNTTTLTATGTTAFKWYSNATLATLLYTGATPSLNDLGITSSASASANTVYLVSDDGTCVSSTVTVTINIISNTAPAITGGSPKSYCVGTDASATTINATGSGTIKWYSNAGLTTEITAGTSTAKTLTNLGVTTGGASSTTFYIVSDYGACLSAVTQLVVHVTALPTLTVNASSTSVCFGVSIFFSASGATTYQFEVKQGVTSIALQAYSATNTYSTSTSLPAGSYNMEVKGLDANGCESILNTIPFTIVAKPASPAITGGSPKSYCVGTNAGTTTISVTGGATIKWYSDIALTTEITAGTSTSKTLTNLGISTVSASSNTFYLISDNGTCASIATPLTINITALPTISVFASATSICAGQTITFVGAGSGTSIQYEFVLKQGVTTIATQTYSTTPFYTTSPSLTANSYSMEVTVQDASGCTSAPNTSSFTVNPIPTSPTVSPSTLNFCVGDAMPNITATGITGGNTVEWFGDASLSSVMATGATVTAASLGISNASANVYTRYVTQRDANCRSVSSLVTINIVSKPFFTVASTQPASNKICEGSTITYTPTGLGTLTYSYVLQRTAPSFLTVETIASPAPATYTIPSSLTAGTYRVVVQATNSFGCSTTTVGTSFTVLTLPTVNFPTPSPSSFSDSQTTPVTLTATPIPGVGETGVFSGSGVSGNQFIPNASGGAGAKTVVYTFTDADGCSNSASITLNVNASGFFIAQSYCEDAGLSALVPVVSCGLITGVTPYAPAPANSIVDVAGTYYFDPSVMTIPIGDDFVLWEGAIYTQTCIPYYIFTRVFRTPAPIISGDNAVCRTEAAVYSTPAYSFSNAGGNVTYLWEFETGPGLVTGTFLSSTSVNFVNVRWNTTGSARLKLTQTNNYTSPTTASCTKIVYYDVVINALPTGSITTTTACQGDTKNYTCTLIAGATYTWNVTNGTIQPDANATDNQITVLWDNISSFSILGTLTAQITNSAGCQNTVNANQVLQALPAPSFGSTNDFEVCVGEVGKVYSVTAVGGHTYAWVVTGGTIQGASNTNSITVNWGATAGTGNVQLTQRNSANCPTIINKDVVINSLPSNTIIGTTSVCEDGTYTYQASTAGSYVYNWSVTNGVIIGLSTSSLVTVKWAVGVGSGTLNLAINEPATGCMNSRNQAIIINPLPNPVTTGSTTVCALSAHIYSVPAVAGRSYAWSISGGTISGGTTSNTVNVVWGTSVAGTLTIIETVDATSCSKQISTNIAINPLPLPAIIGELETCATRVRTYVTPNISGNTYSWSVTGGTIVNANTNQPDITWGSGSAGVITLTETNTTTGCSKIITENVTIRPLPNPVISGAMNVCQSQTAVTYSVIASANQAYEWEVTGGAIVSANNTSSSVVIDWGTGTTGEVKVTQRDNTYATSCTKVATIPITINPLPNPIITGTPVLCALASDTYSVPLITGHAYTWSVVGGAVIAGAGTNSISVSWGSNPAGAQVSVTQIDNNFTTNCSKTVVLPITINPRPTPAITPTANTCLGSTVIYQTAAVSGPGVSYSWSVTNGSIVAGQSTNSVTVEWGSTGTSGTIQVVQTISTGCAWSDFKTITFNSLPAPSIAGDNTPCENSTSIPYQTTLVAGSSYVWTVTGGTFSTVTPYQIEVNWGANGVGSVKVEETNSNGCKMEATLATNILLLPSVSITPTTAVCELSVGNNYQVNSNVGSTYSWSVTGGTITSGSGTNSIMVDWGGAGMGVVTLLETFASGCTRTVSQNITKNALPAPSITPTTNVCIGSPLTPDIAYQTNNVAGMSYIWSVTNGTIVSGQGTNNIVVKWNTTGASGSLSVVQTNTTTNCSTTANTNITFYNLPTPVVTGDDTPCELSVGNTYQTPSVVGSTYVWTVTGGNITAGIGTNAITVQWNGNGVGNVKLVETNNNGCKKEFDFATTILPLPNPDITPKNDICIGSTATYQTTSNVGSIYVWSVTPAGAATVVAAGNQASITWNVAGNANIIVKETFISGCEKTYTENIEVRPLPTPSITGLTVVCADQMSVMYTTANHPNQIYTWSVLGGTIIGTNTTNQIEVDWGNAGVGTITLTQIDNNFITACSKTVSQTITINALPAPIITGAGAVCEYTTGTLYSTPLNVGSSYVWSVAYTDGTPLALTFTQNLAGNEIAVSWLEDGTAQVIVEETNANGCKNISVKNVILNELPNPDITPKNDVCLNSTATYQTTLNSTSNYVWTLTPVGIGTAVQGSTATTKHQATVTWTMAGTATLAVTETDNNGCITTVTENIEVRPLPTPVIAGLTAVCEGQPNVIYSVTALAGNSYTWTVLGGTIIGSNLGNQITVNWGSTGTGTLLLEQTDNNFSTLCKTIVSQSIIIRPLPTPTISSGSGMFEVCANTNGSTYSTPLVAGHTYEWSVVGGTIVGSNTTNVVTINWGTNPTGAKVEVKETNNNFSTNCDKISSQPIFIRPLPTPDIVGDASVCAQSVGKTYTVSAIAGHTYTWTVTGGTIIGTSTTNAITVNWGLNPIGAQVQVTQTDANYPTNCAVMKTLPILMQPLPTPNITGAGITTPSVCASIDNDNFYEHVDSTAFVPGNLYVWTVNPAQGSIVSGQFSNVIRIRWKQGVSTGTITVTQTTNTIPACTVQDTKTVTINSLPATNFNIVNQCFNESTTFTPTITNPNWTWRWEFSEGLPIIAQNASRTFITTGLKTARLIVTNTTTSCEYERDTTFTIHPVPVAKFKYGNSCISTSISLPTQFTDSSKVALPDHIANWEWTIQGVATPYTTQHPIHTFTLPGVYKVRLKVTTNNGCSDTTSQDVRIYPILQPTDNTPYVQDFETDAGNWIAHGTNSKWSRGTPAPTRKIQASTKIWGTGLLTNYDNNTQAYVESPCFDLSQLVRPMISLKTWVVADNKADGASILYSIDGGNKWKTLGEVGKGVSWYNEENILGIPATNNNPRKAGWTGKQTAWKESKYNLDAIKAEALGNTVRFRVAFSSNSDNPLNDTLDGFAFDDVYIGNRQKRALIEHFTTMDANAENDFVDGFSSEATKLQYHTKGILYSDNPADATARSLMYGIAVTSANNTRGALNGFTDATQEFSEWGLDEAERQLLATPAFDIKLAYLPNPIDKLNLEVKLKATRAYPEDVVLHIVMVEDTINNPQVGTTLYRHVVKKMIPSAAGKTIREDWTIGQERIYTENITLYDIPQSTALAPKYYDWNKLKMVVFVQDFNTNEVLQVAELKPTAIPSRVSALADDGQGICKIYPNPASNEVFIGFDQEAFRTYDWEIQNVQGKILRKGTIQKGEMGVQVQTQDLPAGMYIVRITHPQHKATWVGKLVIRK